MNKKICRQCLYTIFDSIGENLLPLPGALLRFKYYHKKATTLLNNSNSLTRKKLIENRTWEN